MIDYKKYTDSQLIALIRETPISNKAFNAVYNRYRSKVFAYCSRRMSNKEDAQEIFQETWINFHSSIIKGKSDIQLPSFIYGIIHNIINNFFRVRKKDLDFERVDLDLNLLSDNLDLGYVNRDNDLLTYIDNIANSLDEPYKAIFFLRWHAGMSYHDIATALNQTETTSRKQGNRAMKKIVDIVNKFDLI